MKHTHKTQEGIVAPFFIIALAIAVVAGGAFWFISNSDSSDTTMSTDTQVKSSPKEGAKSVVLTKPIIKSVAPMTGKVDSKVTITGVNFDAKVNGVMFVSKTGSPIATGFAAYPTSSDGSTLSFEIPSQLSPCPITTPSCPTPAVVQNLVTPRAYTVTVVTEKGSSNFGEFTVTE